MTIEDARNHERGAGVRRDYERAAEIYAELCDEGRGEWAACDALMRAILATRGVARDNLRILRIAGAMCDRGDDVTCLVAWFFEAARGQHISTQPGPSKVEAAEERLKAACEAGDGRACEGIPDFGFGNQSGSADFERRERDNIACRQGWLDPCADLVLELSMCDDGDTDDEVAECERWQLDEWQANEDVDRLAAAARLRELCSAGDALACEELPGQAIAPELLCAAKDYSACAAMGCLGDDAAAATALRFGAAPGCGTHAYRRALRRWREAVRASPDNPPPSPVEADTMDPIGARATAPFDAVLFRAHGGRDLAGWPRLDAYNISKQDIVEIAVCAYGYDDDGAQASQARLVSTVRIPSNGSASLDLAAGNAARLPAAATHVTIDYDQVTFAGAGAPDVDATRCPAQRLSGGRGRGTIHTE